MLRGPYTLYLNFTHKVYLNRETTSIWTVIQHVLWRLHLEQSWSQGYRPRERQPAVYLTECGVRSLHSGFRWPPQTWALFPSSTQSEDAPGAPVWLFHRSLLGTSNGHSRKGTHEDIKTRTFVVFSPWSIWVAAVFIMFLMNRMGSAHPTLSFSILPGLIHNVPL